MNLTELLSAIRREPAHIRSEYAAAGRGHEFDSMVARLKADGRWPFE